MNNTKKTPRDKKTRNRSEIKNIGRLSMVLGLGVAELIPSTMYYLSTTNTAGAEKGDS